MVADIVLPTMQFHGCARAECGAAKTRVACAPKLPTIITRSRCSIKKTFSILDSTKVAKNEPIKE